MGIYKVISDNNKKSLKIKNSLLKLLNVNKINYSNLIIVIGGDGFMLKVLKNKKYSKKFFFGINSGNYGFLMNKFTGKQIINDIKKSYPIIISPLEMIVKTRLKKIEKKFAVNEVSILRQSRQTSKLSIQVSKKLLIKELIADGVLVSTPAGSTAYNLSVHGPILDLNSKKLTISPISPFRPRRWKGKIVKDNNKIIIKNLDPIKRPISAVADNAEIRNAVTVKIRKNDNIKLCLLYNRKQSLHKKITIEQSKREIL